MSARDNEAELHGIQPAYYVKKLGNNYFTCYDIIELMTLDFQSPFEAFLLGNVIKYLWRYKQKNGLQDLLKAQEYLSQIIFNLERDKECKTHTEDGTIRTDWKYSSTNKQE